MALFPGEPQDSLTLQQQGVDALEEGTGAVQAANVSNFFAANLGTRLAHVLANPTPPPAWQGVVDRRGQSDDLAQLNAERGEAPQLLSPEEATAKYGGPGGLKFGAPVAESVARDLHDTKQQQLKNQDIIDRRGDSLLTGMAARGAVGLAVGILDPINLAAGFVPVVGEARALAWVAGASSSIGRAGVRAGIGALQGAGAMAALEPVSLALDAHEHNDWTMGEALHNIAFGGIIGGGLHVLLQHPRLPVTQWLESQSPEARTGALQAGIAQHLAGDPINVRPVFSAAAIDAADAAPPAASALDTTALKSGFAARIAARGEDTKGTYNVFTPEGQRIEARPEVVELDSLIASHKPDGTVNPAYPHAEGLQPRDRTSAASQAQIVELASRLEPERLGPSPEAATGAPVVNDAHHVESGNGRTLALHRVYTDPALADQAAAYRAYLEASGHDTAGMQKPVLIGRRITAMDGDQARAFTRGANERATLGLNTAEQARIDSGRAGAAIDLLGRGAIDGPSNQNFIARFMKDVPAEERAQMLLTNGQLSAQGISRIRAATMAYAYGDALGPSLEKILNGDVENWKAIAGALADEAGAWAKMRGDASAGTIPKALDITGSIGEAVQIMERARSAGRPIAEVLAQTDLLHRPSDATLALLRLMFRDDRMTQPVARAKFADLLESYARQAREARPGPNLFGEPETSATDIMRQIARQDGNAGVASLADALAQAVDPAATAPAADLATSKIVKETAEAAAKDQAGTGAEATLAPQPAPPAGQMTAHRVQLRDKVGYNEAKRRADAENAAAAKPEPAPENQGGLFGEDPAPSTPPSKPLKTPQSASEPAKPAAPSLADASPELRQAMDEAEALAAEARAEVAAGRMDPAALADLDAAEAAVTKAEGTARAYEAAASCMIATGEAGLL